VRITGTEEYVSADAEQVRGSYDFQVKFSVKSLDVEWATQHIKLMDMLRPLDPGGYINFLPMLESAFNFFDPNLASRSLPQTMEGAQRKTLDAARAHLAEIFSGGAPDVTEGMDFGGLATAVTQEIQRSPVRQQAVVGGGQVHIVLTSYLSGLVNNQKEHGGENARIGRTLTEDPLAQPSPAESLLEQLQALPDGVSLWQMTQGGQMPMQSDAA